MPVNKKYLFFCIALSLLLCDAQIRGSTMLTLSYLGIYMLMLVWTCSHNHTLPVLLFFVPWSNLMRISPTSYSFFTLGLVLICGVSIIRGRLKVKNYALLTGICILFLTLLSKLLDGSSLALNYIAFLMMLVILPAVKEENGSGEYDFYHLVVFFSLGIVIAALCAMEYATYPNIAKFIQVDAYNVVLRRCGFYADANFYTAQITAAIGGCLTLLLRETRKDRATFLVVLLFLLIYSGALSASKSFVLITGIMVLAWMNQLLHMEGRVGLKILLLFVVLTMGMVVATSSLFTELIEVISVRFSRTTDLNSFTTNRIEIWESYLDELITDAKVFFLGRGYTNVKVNGRGSHNTILQMFHQFGLLGAPFLLYWVSCFLRDIPSGGKGRKENRQSILVVALGVYLPWLAIDALFFDDFFLLQWYAFMAMQQTLQSRPTAISRGPADGTPVPRSRFRGVQ